MGRKQDEREEFAKALYEDDRAHFEYLSKRLDDFIEQHRDAWSFYQHVNSYLYCGEFRIDRDNNISVKELINIMRSNIDKSQEYFGSMTATLAPSAYYYDSSYRFEIIMEGSNLIIKVAGTDVSITVNLRTNKFDCNNFVTEQTFDYMDYTFDTLSRYMIIPISECPDFIANEHNKLIAEQKLRQERKNELIQLKNNLLSFITGRKSKQKKKK